MTIRVSDIAAAATVLQTVLAALLSSAGPGKTAAGADLRRQTGALSAGAEGAIKTASLGAALLGCFDAAVEAGATLATLRPVLNIITGQTPTTPAAVLVQQACLRMVLVAMARCYATVPLQSRADVDAYVAEANDIFGAAEDAASGAELGADVYRALVALHAAVALDLQTRGQPLPRMVSFKFAARRPSLWIANRLYGDGGREEELRLENAPVHPLFMPASGRALAQ